MAVKTANKKSREPKKGSQKGFEENLWDTANKLRGTVESSEPERGAMSSINTPGTRTG